MSNIRLDTGNVPKPDPFRTGTSAASKTAGGTDADAAQDARNAAAQGLAPDTVELSADARQLSASANVPQGEVTPDQLKQVGQRLATGFYNRTEVQSTLADKIKGDLGTA